VDTILCRPRLRGRSGFTDEGLHAFGRGKRVICMDGWDLSDTLQRAIPLGEVLERKVRRAAETGMALSRVAIYLADFRFEVTVRWDTVRAAGQPG